MNTFAGWKMPSISKPAPAASADRAVVGNARVTDLAGRPVAPTQQPPLLHDPAADPLEEGNVQRVARPAARAEDDFT